MRSRYILGVAIFCGALCVLGETAQAATPNSSRFVRVLLLNQAAQIRADNAKIATLNRDVAKLGTATNPRQIKSLSASISRLNNQILNLTAKLVLLSTQTYTTAVNLSPSSPSLVSQALANLLTVQNISLQVGLGITPATPSQ